MTGDPDDDAPSWQEQPRDSEGRWATADDLLGHVVEWDLPE